MSFHEVEFADNPEPRCPCVLLLDTSGSMGGDKLDRLNEGLRLFQQQLTTDALAAQRVEVAVVEFNSEVNVVQDFVTANNFVPPVLVARGLTHIGTAIQTALDMVQARKQLYKQNGIQYYRPWVFLVTDGEPQGEADFIVEQATQRLKIEEDAKRVAFFAVGVEGANLERLATISIRQPIKLQGLDFKEMFIWLSSSMHGVSNSRLGDQVPLAPPTGWGSV